MQFVSLGGNCAVTYQLNKYHKREQAYPFDWCKITASQLLNTLTNDFENFTILETKKDSYNHTNSERNINHSLILKTKDNIQFAHEISSSEEFDIFAERLLLRIQRFKELEEPIFIRLETQHLSSKQMDTIYSKIDNVLQKLFPKFKMILISLNKYDSSTTEWIQLDTFEADWKYPSISWNIILNPNDI